MGRDLSTQKQCDQIWAAKPGQPIPRDRGNDIKGSFTLQRKRRVFALGSLVL